MKKIIVLAALLISFTMATHAQGNLQFNRVISSAANLANNSSIGLMTVPSDKVWKLEGINFISTNTLNIQINGVNVPGSVNWCFPFWLSAGTTFNLTASGGASQVQYSIIEYNIVP
jgi:hypothetical protein